MFNNHALVASLVTGLALLAVGSEANAQSPGSFAYRAPGAPIVPGDGFFFGLGGSYNSVNFGNRDMYVQGVSNVYQGPTLVANGFASGTNNVNMPMQSTLAPDIQIGYFQHFADSRWLWGTKFNYSYLGSTAAASSFLVPQAGSFTMGATVTPFTGNVPIGSFQTNVSHQMMWLAFLGHSFDAFSVYLGAGPSLSQIQTRYTNIAGFALLSGVPSLIAPRDDYSTSGWVAGGAVSLGAIYFFNPNWFLDFSYTYDATLSQTGSFSGPFTNTSQGYTTIGTLSGNSSGRLTTQSLNVSINVLFDANRGAGWIK
jgi:opacity protein-like surface antigen